ncbi:GNAT family N-acetyltransferase [Pseudonocardia alaniniphila]|uniref:GNAT family N-acetyltransferase n=1 Tax=Pseudonocardia alaniniphila TaxID=75291 RepID=A0ABS9THU2_9PSEU|nr:GNAT family N-acetyltransferase [Pseudonocardia alaniniphila]MCH6167963.1 GNAT family N-acetyltransferase [Pseudonocardia alaniniphila]
MPVVRPYRPADRSALVDICVRTGDAGEDARALYPDPELLANIFALPYVEYEPQFAFVVDDGGQAVGYVLGTSDTPAYVTWLRREWLPALSRRYPPPTGRPATRAEGMIALLHQPERILVPEVAAYPAHLHIDLLPAYQGAGNGRALMTAFLAALARAGITAVHLGMASTNTRAGAFYGRMGFHEIPVPAQRDSTYFGRSTDPL